MSWQPEIDEIKRRYELAERMGGQEGVDRQHGQGKLTIRERLELLVDAGTFEQMGKLQGGATYDAEGKLSEFTPSAGVRGLALVNGRRVYVSGQDFTVRGGSGEGDRSGVDVGHGQMPEGELEPVMQKFVNGETDVLVSTTIIESGIDIPNANTILIDRADMFGLADLYQLRGRVGRSGRRAYAILMLPRHLLSTGDARKRINAIKQYSSLGSGFKIAMRDLEIRGAGNLLGTQQSGHIMAVGFDLYCKMLKRAVAQLQGKRIADRPDVALRIDFVTNNEAQFQQSDNPDLLPAYIPEDFIPDARLRIAAYRMVAEITTFRELKSLVKNWRDRFGTFPPAVDNLLRCLELKVAAANVQITSVEIEQNKLKLMRKGTYVLITGKFPRLCLESDSQEKLIEAVSMVRQF